MRSVQDTNSRIKWVLYNTPTVEYSGHSPIRGLGSAGARVTHWSAALCTVHRQLFSSHSTMYALLSGSQCILPKLHYVFWLEFNFSLKLFHTMKQHGALHNVICLLHTTLHTTNFLYSSLSVFTTVHRPF